jgi:hypothetical protein
LRYINPVGYAGAECTPCPWQVTQDLIANADMLTEHLTGTLKPDK